MVGGSGRCVSLAVCRLGVLHVLLVRVHLLEDVDVVKPILRGSRALR